MVLLKLFGIFVLESEWIDYGPDPELTSPVGVSDRPVYSFILMTHTTTKA